ncbi:MAG: sigma-70 family RNA polymerase sigma factor [Tepidisphaera sp.]
MTTAKSGHPGDPDHEITLLLRGCSPADPLAADRLFPLLYDELRRLAAGKLRDTPGAGGRTLQATALVHEAFLKLVGKDAAAYENRRHFFFAAARAMQDILVEYARQRNALKRGSGSRGKAIQDHDAAIGPAEADDDVEAIAEKLAELEAMDPRKAQIVRLRYFAGLTAEETAAAMEISLSTVEREWRFARALLHTLLGKASGAP